MFKIRWDGTYSRIVEAHPEDPEAVSFMGAKQELVEYCRRSVDDWRFTLREVRRITRASTLKDYPLEEREGGCHESL